jgi:hypothetical protein
MPKALHGGDQMKPAATKIISPSTPAAKYCALPWPKLWFSWGGRAAPCRCDQRDHSCNQVHP